MSLVERLTEDRQFLTSMLSACGVRGGGRVLDLGCGDGLLVDRLAAIGYDAAGLSPNIEADEDRQLYRGVLANSVPFAAGEADAAVLRDIDAYAEDLDGLETLISSANLLSCLRPLGRLVFLRDDAVAPMGSSRTARQSEIAAHFDRFPVRTQVISRGEGLGRFLSPSFLLGRRPRSGASVVVVQVPKKPVNRLEWHGYAREAAMSGMRAAA